MIHKILIVASLIFISCKPAKKEPLVLLDCIPQNTVAAFQLKDQNMLKNTITNFPFLEALGKINDSLYVDIKALLPNQFPSNAIFFLTLEGKESLASSLIFSSNSLDTLPKNIIGKYKYNEVEIDIEQVENQKVFNAKIQNINIYSSSKLVLENKKVEPKNFTKQIAFNVIPHIDVFSDDGYTKEELKMVNETKKILDNKIDLTATCVRLPVLVSHSESVNIEFEKTFTLEKVREALNNFEGCKVIDKRSDGGYSTPLEAEGRDETFISRIREDKTINNGLNMWIVSDNLLRGAALNSVEIAETLIKNNFYGK
mgnify:CR=1 FL=1